MAVTSEIKQNHHTSHNPFLLASERIGRKVLKYVSINVHSTILITAKGGSNPGIH
jgi:hypothetical protein